MTMTWWLSVVGQEALLVPKKVRSEPVNLLVFEQI